MAAAEKQSCRCRLGRLYYLALPPTVYPVVCRGLKRNCDSISSANPENWIRLIVEKPFGRDTDSSEELAEQLGELYDEHEIYRIDHYLGALDVIVRSNHGCLNGLAHLAHGLLPPLTSRGGSHAHLLALPSSGRQGDAAELVRAAVRKLHVQLDVEQGQRGFRADYVQGRLWDTGAGWLL